MPVLVLGEIMTNQDDLLSFAAALRLVLTGWRITKLEWADAEYWGQMLNGQLVLRKPDGIYYPWILSDGDISGNDWQAIPENDHAYA